MLASVAEVRPGERRGAAAAFLTLFGILASHTLLETARDALFLARLPPSQLPWVYLSMAAIAILFAQGPWRAPGRVTAGRRSLAVLLVACAVGTFFFWLAGSWEHPWQLRALYVWSGLLGTLTALQFWMVLGELYTVTQAKRIYKVVAAGSLLGAVAGAGAARLIAESFGAPVLVLASAGVLAATGLGPAMFVRRPAGGAARAAEAGPTLVQAVRLVGNHPYVKMLGGLVLVSTVALTLADYVFKSTVAREIPARELGAFFATFYMVLNGLALLVQTVLMGWLLRVLGLHRTLWILPALIFLGAAGVALGGGLVAAYLLKGADGTLRHSLHRTGTELLFVPLPDGLRSRAKPIIDVVGQRGGQALASLLILAEISQGRGNTVLAIAAAALCILWIAWASELRRHYLDLFRAALREGSMGVRSAHAFDLGSLEAVFSGLNSRNDPEVLGAMDILADEGRVRLIPALILFHPSKDVVLRALELFGRSGRADFVPVADRLLDHADEEIRAAAVRARTAGEADQAILAKAAKDPSPLVRATAAVGLVAGGWMTDALQATVDELAKGPSPEARRALARALREQPVAAFDGVLHHLAETGDDLVQVDVAHALGVRRDPKFLPVLLPMLGSRPVRTAARAALVEHGEGGLAFLAEALRDETLPHEVRRHVPRSISRFPPADAAAVLVSRLLEEPDGMVRYKILRGLGRIAADHPDVALDPGPIRESARLTAEQAYRLLDWRVTLDRGAAEVPARKTPGHELLSTLLRDKEVHAIERLFRMLGLLHRGEDFETIYRGLRGPNPKVRASSRELLEHVLEPSMRGPVLGLVDDTPDLERLAHAPAAYRPVRLAYDRLLFTLLDQPGETLRCIAAYHVGELGLTEFRERLESFQRQPAGLFVQRVIERALALLSTGERLQFAR
jgi:ATP/ADP translocase/HEAT repeat protein